MKRKRLAVFAVLVLAVCLMLVGVAYATTITYSYTEINGNAVFYEVSPELHGQWNCTIENTLEGNPILIWFSNYEIDLDNPLPMENQYIILFLPIYDELLYSVAFFNETEQYDLLLGESYTGLFFSVQEDTLTIEDGVETHEFTLNSTGVILDLTNILILPEAGDFTAGSLSLTFNQIPYPTPDTLNLDSHRQFWYEGDLFGFFQSIYVSAFLNADLFYGVVAMLFLVPIFIKTKSLILMCILWILLGGLFIAAFPLVSGIAILFLALGVGGLLFKLIRGTYA